MALAASLALGLASCGCEEPPDAAPDGPVASSETEPEAAREPDGPWALRFARRCSEWAHDVLLATDRHVFACNGAVYDRDSGEMVAVQDEMAFPAAATGALSLWEKAGDADLVVRGPDLVDSPLPVPEQVHGAVASPDGSMVVAAGVHHLYAIDPVARTVRAVEGADGCTSANAFGFADDGTIRCVGRCDEDRSCLLGPGVERTPLDVRARSARFDPRGGRVLVVGANEAKWLDLDGTVLGAHAVTGHPRIVAAAPDGAMLVTGESGTELWRLEGGETVVEPVVPRRAQDGVFAGEQIVLRMPSRTVLWVHRGEAMERPELPTPEAPPGFAALAADVDGDSPSFEGERTVVGRALPDVAAFEKQGQGFAHVIVSRTDARELARFANDDDAWARMAAARYVEPGSRRWARWWRGEAGRRVVRGHAYIGGCERTHIDVRITERSGWLERWVVYSGDGGVDDALGAIPETAVEIPEARSERYPGDPSVGSL